jgi:hypothetical protein
MGSILLHSNVVKYLGRQRRVPLKLKSRGTSFYSPEPLGIPSTKSTYIPKVKSYLKSRERSLIQTAKNEFSFVTYD